MIDEYRRIQIYFSRRAGATELSHLELVRALEEAFDASGLPVRRTNDRMKISLATALPRGMPSRAEAMEVPLHRSVTIREILEGLERVLPPGMKAWGADALYPGEKWTVAAIEYFVADGDPGLPGEAEIAAFLARDAIPVERRRRIVDLKPLLLRLDRAEGGLRTRIAWTESGTARPADLVRALGRDPEDHPAEKLATIFSTSFGERFRKPNDLADPHQRPGTR